MHQEAAGILEASGFERNLHHSIVSASQIRKRVISVLLPWIYVDEPKRAAHARSSFHRSGKVCIDLEVNPTIFCCGENL